MEAGNQKIASLGKEKSKDAERATVLTMLSLGLLAPVWLATDSGAAATREIEALKARNARLDQLALERCHEVASGPQSDPRAEVLWKEFQDAYPEYAKHPHLVELAAIKVVAQAQAQGVSVDDYMFKQSKLFFDDVLTEIDRMTLHHTGAPAGR
jgi:hypothetical protein